MNKRVLIKKIISQLNGELEIYFRAANASRAEATHEQSKAESKYDTRGQSRQAAEIESAIAEFEKLEVRKFGADEAIGSGAFVELEHQGRSTFYFIGPKAGGTEVLHGKLEVLVITPQSPLGEQLLGKKPGDDVQLAIAGAREKYRVVSVA